LYLASQRTDYAGGQGRIQAKGIADGKYFAPNGEFAGIAQGEGGEMFSRRFNLKHRQIPLWGQTYNFSWPGTLVLQSDHDLARPVYHMEVGDDITALIPHETGTAAAGHFQQTQRTRIANQLLIGHEHHARPRFFKHLDGVALIISGEVGPGAGSCHASD